MLRLQTESGHSLVLTEKHLIPIYESLTTSQPTLLRAEQAIAGTFLKVFEGKV